MSVAEIKRELRHLSPSELEDIERFAADLRRSTGAGHEAPRVVSPNDADVAPAMDAVLSRHGALLKRLAE